MRGPFDRQRGLAVLLVVVIAAAGSYYLFLAGQRKTTLYVPQADLPAYHLITPTDLVTTTLPISNLPADVYAQQTDLINRYTRQTLPAGKAIVPSQLVSATDEKYVTDTVAIAFPATAALAYNGQLSSGTIVTAWDISDSSNPKLLLDEVLILDVQRVEGQKEAVENGLPYVIVLAVPRAKQAEFLTAVATNSLILTLAP